MGSDSLPETSRTLSKKVPESTLLPHLLRMSARASDLRKVVPN